MWAPDTASYGYDSRAASIRILSAPGVPLPATRFEVRVPGADVSVCFSLVCFSHHVLHLTAIPLIFHVWQIRNHQMAYLATSPPHCHTSYIYLSRLGSICFPLLPHIHLVQRTQSSLAPVIPLLILFRPSPFASELLTPLSLRSRALTFR
jgi:hypothetical protein